jgi:hypothetical protein
LKTKIETQARKKAKLTPYMDVMDFQIILLTGLVIPFAIWLLTGIEWVYTVWLVLGYTAWMITFKVGKASGYSQHWWKYHLRGKAWTGYSQGNPPEGWCNLRG